MCHLSPQNSQENPAHKKLAGLHLEKYSFPVEMMICLPNGTVVGSPQPLHPPGPSRQRGAPHRDLIELQGWLHDFLPLSQPV